MAKIDPMMPYMEPHGEAFVQRYEMFLKELAKALRHDESGLLALDLFATMKWHLAMDFNATLKSAVYSQIDDIEERTYDRYRRELERLTS